MGRYRKEPPPQQGAASRVGVLLVNLGTPEAPTAPAVRRYLAEFLADPRVVEIPRVAWTPILHGVILRVRPARSARKYAAIWTAEGSPLLVHSVRQQSLLKGLLGERLKGLGLAADHAVVELGMRYGAPSIADALGRLREAGCDRVLVLPLYPQYAASATASAFDAVFAQLQAMRRVPALRTVDGFHDDRGYIRALARRVNDHWTRHGRPDRLVLSFHGLPRRSTDLGDPYAAQCEATARLLAEALGLDRTTCVTSFQSRFGRAEWLQPYTQATVESFARQGRSVHVFCPGFVSDCLETLEEIGIEVRQAYVAAGGRAFEVIPCLNEDAAWIEALAGIVLTQLAGWLDAPDPDGPAARGARAKAAFLR